MTTTPRRSTFASALIAAGLLVATTFAVGPSAGAATPTAVHAALRTGSAVVAGLFGELDTDAATKAKKKTKKKAKKKVAKKVAKKPAAAKPVASKPAPTQAPPPAASVAPTALESQVVTLTNAQRAANGCGPLRITSALTQAARAHSADMATHNYFSHTGRDGSTFSVRAARAGYTQASAENIAWGYRSAEAVVTGWMNSEGHRRNILNCASVAVGVGVANKADGTPYYTQIFGRV